MSLTKSEARTRLRQRLKDTDSPYNFSDALLYTYMENAIREIGTAVREVDPNVFLTFRDVNGYTDALDAAASGSQGYEFYPLPADCGAVRWIERGDGSLHYKLWDSSARDQEAARQSMSGIYGRATVDGSTYVSIPTFGGFETAAVFGDRFRVIPPPTASGPVYRVFYERRAAFPDGDNEVLEDVPELFEKPFVDIARYLALADDGDPMAEVAHKQAYGVPGTSDGGSLGAAQQAHRRRARPTVRLGPVW